MIKAILLSLFIASVISLPGSPKGLVVFELTNCPACEELNAYLDNHNVAYTKKIVDADPIAEKEFRQTGLHYVPSSFLDGKYIGNVQETELLEQSGKLPYKNGTKHIPTPTNKRIFI